MPSDSEKSKRRREEQNLRALRDLLDLPENRHCADCGDPAPQWASVNIGCFLCQRCAGMHRQLGTHISRVKSITLDTWTEEWLETMRLVGNRRSNAKYLANADQVHPPVRNDHEMSSFIRKKYESKEFASSAKRGSTSGESVSTRDIEDFKGQLRTLASMGFNDQAKAVSALKRANGRIDDAIEILVSGRGPASSPRSKQNSTSSTSTPQRGERSSSAKPAQSVLAPTAGGGSHKQIQAALQNYLQTCHTYALNDDEANKAALQNNNFNVESAINFLLDQKKRKESELQAFALQPPAQSARARQNVLSPTQLTSSNSAQLIGDPLAASAQQSQLLQHQQLGYAQHIYEQQDQQLFQNQNQSQLQQQLAQQQQYQQQIQQQLQQQQQLQLQQHQQQQKAGGLQTGSKSSVIEDDLLGLNDAFSTAQLSQNSQSLIGRQQQSSANQAAQSAKVNILLSMYNRTPGQGYNGQSLANAQPNPWMQGNSNQLQQNQFGNQNQSQSVPSQQLPFGSQSQSQQQQAQNQSQFGGQQNHMQSQFGEFQQLQPGALPYQASQILQQQLQSQQQQNALLSAQQKSSSSVFGQQQSQTGVFGAQASAFGQQQGQFGANNFQQLGGFRQSLSAGIQQQQLGTQQTTGIFQQQSSFGLTQQNQQQQQQGSILQQRQISTQQGLGGKYVLGQTQLNVVGTGKTIANMVQPQLQPQSSFGLAPTAFPRQQHELQSGQGNGSFSQMIQANEEQRIRAEQAKQSLFSDLVPRGGSGFGGSGCGSTGTTSGQAAGQQGGTEQSGFPF